MILDIKQAFSSELAKKILANSDNMKEYLKILSLQKEISNLYSENRKKESVIKKSSEDLLKLIVSTWDYNVSKSAIREIFKDSQKYKRGKEANNAVKLLKEEWENLSLGEFNWPFSPNDFDGFVQRINNENNLLGKQKDEKVKEAAVKFRRIKEINTYRNDFIETLIFEKSEHILPTLSHTQGVDFFIGGVSYDQKVSRSVTNQFKNKYKDDWRSKAIQNPIEVAEYLYTYQDEARFGANPRLLIVYIDEDVSVENIIKKIEQTDFSKPYEITFTFQHSKTNQKTYKAPCFIILLHN